MDSDYPLTIFYDASCPVCSLEMDHLLVRPSLIFGRGSESAALSATLASLPVIALPGPGRQAVQPIHVFEVAEAIAGLVERSGSARGVDELGGKDRLDYQRMLACYRHALGLGEAFWLREPMPLMRFGARLAESVPQRVYSRDTLLLLERQRPGPQCSHSAARPRTRRPRRRSRRDAATAGVRSARGAGRAGRFRPARGACLSLDLHRGDQRVVAGTLGCAGPVGALRIRRRRRLRGARRIMCAHVALGTLTLLRPSVLLYAVQCFAIAGYTITAAIYVPELTLDHGGPWSRTCRCSAASSCCGSPAQRVPLRRTTGLRRRYWRRAARWSR